MGLLSKPMFQPCFSMTPYQDGTSNMRVGNYEAHHITIDSSGSGHAHGRLGCYAGIMQSEWAITKPTSLQRICAGIMQSEWAITKPTLLQRICAGIMQYEWVIMKPIILRRIYYEAHAPRPHLWASMLGIQNRDM